MKFENMEMARGCVTQDRLLGADCFGGVHFGHMYGTIGLAIKSLKPVKVAAD